MFKNVQVATDPDITLVNFPYCTNPFSTFPVEITVKGKTVGLLRSPHDERGACKECFELYLNSYSITCSACGYPIMPTMQVAGPMLPDNVFLHSGCAGAGCLSGLWGEGHMVPLRWSTVKLPPRRNIRPAEE